MGGRRADVDTDAHEADLVLLFETAANIGEEEYSAGLLDKIFNAQDQFGFQKQGMRLQGQGAKGGAISNYLGALSNASSFDDILAGLGTASKFIKPFKL